MEHSISTKKKVKTKQMNNLTNSKKLLYPNLTADLDLCREQLFEICQGKCIKTVMSVPPRTTDYDMQFSAAFDELQNYRDLEKQGLLLRLPCKAGEKLFVLSSKECSVGNDYEMPCEDTCELFEPYLFTLGGSEYNCCKKSYNEQCPTVVKPITVELFEVDENGIFPCYRVDYEGNSKITDWSKTRQAAEKALTEMDLEENEND